MAHIPHLLLAGPWVGESIAVDTQASHHLTRALRRTDGDEVSYTDGQGRVGRGTYRAGSVLRGSEHDVARRDLPVIAVPPPTNKDRARILVEKLAELGVTELLWLQTEYGEGRPPAAARSAAWCRSALEQSRSAWLLMVPDELVPISSLPSGSVFADQTGARPASLAHAPCVAIGPEGGWAPGEIPSPAERVSLADGVLRVETAAIAAAVLANLN
jgi:RsmE family RNA methyltransferase